MSRTEHMLVVAGVGGLEGAVKPLIAEMCGGMRVCGGGGGGQG